MSYAKTTELNGSGSITEIQLSEAEQALVCSAFSNKTEVAVLLLDAENLQLNAETEKFLTTVCTCPIQIKIAFANWCSMGKLDVELHGRGYDLIHVPIGKDNADGKMIAFGSSIHERYPKAREVLVCSSDKVMTNLCNHLRQHGLTVYQVSQQGEDITVLNSYTGQVVRKGANTGQEIPAIAQFIQQIKELIKTEQKCTRSYWINLATLSQTYKNKYKISITQVAAKYLPGKKAREIFVNYPAEFVLHQIEPNAPVYITLFEVPEDKDMVIESTAKSLSANINSKVELEQALKRIVSKLTHNAPGNYIKIGPLGSEFMQQYGKPISAQIKTLQLSCNFIKFLQSCTSLQLKQTPKGWEIAVK
ncbi:NYN domain-containing protein [Nostoc sp. LEGE 06077]|uniref:NYN domain-containing protein n=1 Tax=Nostoc sp. LEGE 06077 TaxID=915325 RepID=UPI001882AC46|nr:NYN domain-containing protein [Nostoc sp. LEGE 06077]MBE9206415.1 NYN domain-containing protein [Nostoc sp. LEGE 06077]